MAWPNGNGCYKVGPHCDPHADRNANAYPYPDPDTDANPNCNPYSNPHSHRHADPNWYLGKGKAEELANGMKDKLGIVWRWDGNAIKFDAPSGMAKGASGQVAGLQVADSGPVLFAGVLCHAARLVLQTRFFE